MIKKYFLLVLFFPIAALAQDMFSELDKSFMETSILYDRAYKVVDITKENKNINASYFIQAYSELAQADYSNYFKKGEFFLTEKEQGFKENFVPLGLINVKYDQIIENALIDELIYFDDTNKIRATNNQIFETDQSTFMSPLLNKVRSLRPSFKLRNTTIYNSNNVSITNIKINFNDGLGLRELTIDTNIQANYYKAGKKKIDFEITLSNGEVKKNSAFIIVEPSSQDLNNLKAPGDESPITPINASIGYQGFGETISHIGTGEYKIYYDNVDGVFDKPVIFVDGFDPGDDRTIPLMYDLLNFGDPVQNLADTVRDEGFDLVVLNFPIYTSSSDGTTVIDGGGDFIQRNAFILIELINTLNSMKVGNEENVVIGPSMGGLISRYALRYMEQNTMDHDTRLYLSFDSPHLGANVPIGLQYLFNYMVYGAPGITAAQPMVDGLLGSAAAKQMLFDHYLGHVDGGGIEQDPSKTLPIGAPNFRDAFQSEIDAMGFPLNTRNVTMVNGSGIGNMTGTPGMNLLNNNFSTGATTSADIVLNFTPSANTTAIVTDFTGYLLGIPLLFFDASAASPSYSAGIDSAPGGLFDMGNFDDGTDPLITDFVNNLTTPYFNFIPSVSGLALEITNNEIDWYHNIDLGTGDQPNGDVLNNTPFVNWHIPDNNEPHVEINDANVAFALSEIILETLDINDANSGIIRLEKNPIQDNIVLLNNSEIINVDINIADISGKLIYQSKDHVLTERTILDIDLNSGIYFLNLIHQNSRVQNFKILIN